MIDVGAALGSGRVLVGGGLDQFARLGVVIGGVRAGFSLFVDKLLRTGKRDRLRRVGLDLQDAARRPREQRIVILATLDIEPVARPRQRLGVTPPHGLLYRKSVLEGKGGSVRVN